MVSSYKKSNNEIPLNLQLIDCKGNANSLLFNILFNNFKQSHQ